MKTGSLLLFSLVLSVSASAQCLVDIQQVLPRKKWNPERKCATGLRTELQVKRYSFRKNLLLIKEGDAFKAPAIRWEMKQTDNIKYLVIYHAEGRVEYACNGQRTKIPEEIVFQENTKNMPDQEIFMMETLILKSIQTN